MSTYKVLSTNTIFPVRQLTLRSFLRKYEKALLQCLSDTLPLNLLRRCVKTVILTRKTKQILLSASHHCQWLCFVRSMKHSGISESGSGEWWLGGVMWRGVWINNSSSMKGKEVFFGVGFCQSILKNVKGEVRSFVKQSDFRCWTMKYRWLKVLPIVKQFADSSSQG